MELKVTLFDKLSQTDWTSMLLFPMAVEMMRKLLLRQKFFVAAFINAHEVVLFNLFDLLHIMLAEMNL
jgi:hypothetical protein